VKNEAAALAAFGLIRTPAFERAGVVDTGLSSPGPLDQGLDTFVIPTARYGGPGSATRQPDSPGEPSGSEH
jgi:hypothetical protein